MWHSCRLRWFCSPGLLRTAAWTGQSPNSFTTQSLARFPAHDSYWLELLGHRVAKISIWVIALGTLTAAFATERIRHNPHEQRAIVIAVLAMALGPMMVSALKYSHQSSLPVGFASVWRLCRCKSRLVCRSRRCRPLLSKWPRVGRLCADLAVLPWPRDRPATACARRIDCGHRCRYRIFCAVRVVQGAHFVSHNLWAAAIDWFAAALVFTPLLASRRDMNAIAVGRAWPAQRARALATGDQPQKR